jgi:ankyrin repeat protein
MDDVVIDISMKDEKQFGFAMQLKHKDNDSKKLSPESFETANGPFSLKRYCQAFKNLNQRNRQYQFILYTNAEFDPQKATKVTNFNMIKDDRCNEDMFFNTSSEKENVYRFEVNDKTPSDKEITKSDYKKFFSRFTIFVCQKNFEDLERAVIKILENETAAMNYTNLFRKWHQGRFTNKTINKATVNLHLIDIFLSPFVSSNSYLLTDEYEEGNLFQRVVQDFDIVLINDSLKNYADTMTEISEEVMKKYKTFGKDANVSTDECILRVAKENKIIEKSVTSLEPDVKLKVLQYFFEKQLVIDFNIISEKCIYKIMELHQLRGKIKFILIGHGIQCEKLSRFKIFENLNNLSINETLYRNVIQECLLSLQGRKEITLEKLIESIENICEYVGAKELLQMLKGNFLVGQETEFLPSYYIDRKVSFEVLEADQIFDHTFLKENLVVINFDGKLDLVRNKLRKCNINVMSIEHYLKLTKVSKESVIISTNEQYSVELLGDISKKNRKSSIVCLRLLDEDSLSVVMSTHSLPTNLSWRRISIKENQIYDHLTRPINILCADPGMGKSTMLKKLRKECDSKFWITAIDLKTHNEFLKTKHDIDDLLNYLLGGNQVNFSDQIRNIFRSKKKVVFFFDGLDEIETQYTDNVLNYVKELSSKGYHIWLSSRKNLKDKLKDHFGEFIMDMEEVNEVQQKSYITNRLETTYEYEEIKNLINKIFNSTDIINNCQVLGIPLQLYIITQTFLDDRELYDNITENIFVLTKMYNLFFRGKFKHHRDKEQSNNPHLDLTDMEDCLEKYELLAVHSMFDDNVFQKLNVDMRRTRRFLHEFKTNKDILGIVTKVNTEGKAEFEHYTYGEYFAAYFFANNFDKARIIQKELFSNRYKNLMMIFNVILAEESPIHLALIYQNMDQFAKHVKNKNMYDKGGRNPLHIVACSEPRFNSLTLFSSQFSVKIEDYLKNIRILEKLVHSSNNKSDTLFQWTPLEYALENNYLAAAEVILKRCGCSMELFKYTKNYQNNSEFIHFCLTHSCTILLSSIVNDSIATKNMIEENSWNFIEHTILNCYFEESGTLRYLIDTFGASHRFIKGNKGFDVNYTNKEGLTALHLAVKHKKRYAVKLLIEKGASVNFVTVGNQTPLHLAVSNRDTEITKLLIQNGASINAATSLNQTPLYLAIENGDVITAKLLIERGAFINAVTSGNVTPLHLVVANGNVEIAKLLINKGASIDAVTRNNKTPLHWAAYNKKMEAAEFLIKKGASVNATTKDNETPLHLAVMDGDVDMVKLLIKKGAFVKVATNDNETPLHLAVNNENTEIVELLIGKGACVNAVTHRSETALHYAACNGNFYVVELLIEHGAWVDAITKSKKTPLHFAAYNGNMKTAKLLIEKGASVDAVTNSHKTPLHWAAYSGKTETAELLIKKGASVNAVTSDNKTPLHFAIDNGNVETATLLIERGASVDAETNGDLAKIKINHGKNPL